MKNLCVIPARGGSKRIPRKNIKDFLGKPIIAYSIEAALKSGLFDEVMVSTEDEEISEIAKKFGANVPFVRRETTANDFSTTVDVLLEVLEEYQKLSKTFDTICCLYPTAPFVSSKKLQQAYSKLVLEKFDSVFPIVPFGFPIQRALKLQSAKVEFFYGEYINARSQDLEKAFHDAGQFYFITGKSFYKSKNIITTNTGGILVEELEAQDIDNPIDWKIAEIKYELLQTLK